MRGADALIRCFQAEKVKFIAGITSGSTLEITDALLKAPEIMSILTRHERVAGDLADGYARASHHPGLCIAVKGPGASQLFGSLAQSYYDHVPVLALMGDTPRHLVGTLDTQEMPVTSVFGPLTKWCAVVNSAARVPEFVQRAFHNLRNAPNGPAVLSLPQDVMNEAVDEAAFAYRPTVDRALLRSGPDPDAVERAAELLANARAPLIYAGAGVLWARASAELVELAELLAAPVMTTIPGKSSFPENHALALGIGGFPQSSLGSPVAHHFASTTDCLFAIGNTFSGQATLRQPIKRALTIIHSNVDATEVNRLYQTDEGLVGDAQLVLRALVAAVRDRIRTRRDASAVAGAVKQQRDAWLAAWHSRLTSDAVPMNPYRVTWDLMGLVDRTRTTMLNDAGAVRGYLCHHWESVTPGTFMGMGNQSEMGWSLGAALGAKLARPDHLVAHVIGDGSFGMTGYDVETAVRYGIPTLCLIYNNGGMGITKDNQRQMFGGRYTMVDLEGDHIAVARALGAWAERVDKPQEIAPTLERAIRVTREGRPAVVEFVIKQLEPQPRPTRPPGE